MAASATHSETFLRSARMLRTALGPAIAAFLEDPAIVEVMLNPDGRLWVDRLSGGLEDTGATLSPADGERIVRLVAHHVGAEVHAAAPRISAKLPETGERFEGLLPPVVTAPAFAIRKPAVAVFTLDDYATAGIMTAVQAAILRRAVAARKNILVLQLLLVAFSVVGLSGGVLVTPSPEGPAENEGEIESRLEKDSSEQIADFRHGRHEISQ